MGALFPVPVGLVGEAHGLDDHGIMLRRVMLAVYVTFSDAAGRRSRPSEFVNRYLLPVRSYLEELDYGLLAAAHVLTH